MNGVIKRQWFPSGRGKERTFIFCLIFFLSILPARSQTTATALFTSNQPPTPGNYLKNSTAFRQEIARMQINVVRGEKSLPITQVPRVQKGDVIKMRLLDEAVGGIKPSESLWDWTFLVAFVNPNRKGIGEGKQSAVSEEIQFRKTGWYKEYSFVVPYDSQPVFFLYPRPKYRAQILKLVNKKYEEVRKLGEKTIELANAYSRIDSFLTELQAVLYRTQSSYYGNFVTYPKTPVNNSTSPYNSANPYNPYGGSLNPYNPYNPGSGGYYNGGGNNNTNLRQPDPIYNFNAFFEQTIERLAASFNITLPSCWQTFNGGYNYFGTPGGYGGSYGGLYNSAGYGYGSASGNSANSFGHAVSSEFIGRAQCVARNIRLEDFDFSVSRLLQEGGMFALTQLRDKYPQLAYYINLAAVAIEFIVKVFQKYPMKIVPTIIQTSDNNGYLGAGGGNYASSSNSYPLSYSPNSGNVNGSAGGGDSPPPVKISVYAESQPSDTDSVTAYPVVVHKWQSEPDPDVISLAPPVLVEPCLHAGQNILKSADITTDESDDVFTRNFKLSVASTNGFKKEFSLRKNPGAGGWELNLTNEDLSSFPKIQMTLEASITGTRGFNEIKSPKFALPVNTGNSWQIRAESRKAFAVGGKRVVTLQNAAGDCRCLQAVVYKPSFGGQFVFEAGAKDANNQLQFSADGREVSFEIDTAGFQPGAGTLELKTYGDNQPQTQQTPQPNQQAGVLPIKLYPLPPEITDFRIAGGDRQATITGSRLEQLQWVKANGKKMIIVGNNPAVNQNNPNNPNASAAAGQSANQNLPPAPIYPASGNSNQSFNPNQNPNERTAVFEDAGARQGGGGVVTLELGLDDDRSFPYPKEFKVSPSRPMIVADANNEIEGAIVSNNLSESDNVKSSRAFQRSALSLGRLASFVFPIDAKEISVNVQTALTDYDFKPENISIETRIENGGTAAGSGEMSRASFEVFDWKSLRLTIALNEQTSKIIGGRRLQFRIRDGERGASDWYTIKQTFVRMPEIKSVVCAGETNGQCEMKGYGLEYMGQISTDGGKTWYPNNNETLQVRQTPGGQSSVMIPPLENKKSLQIKLRDFPKTDGINVADFAFSNTARNMKRKISANQTLNTPENARAGSPDRQNGNSATSRTPSQTVNQPSLNPTTQNAPPAKSDTPIVKSKSVKTKRTTRF